MKPILFCYCLMIMIIACAAPRTSVKTDDQSGTMVFKVKPSYATISVDGKEVGKAREYDGKNAVLKLSPGTHQIQISAEGYKGHNQKVYLSDTQEIIELNLEEE